jgi:two-component system OmpR family response regulator
MTDRTQRTLLVVDDEPDIRDTLAYRLSLEERFDVVTAGNGLEALGAVRLHRPEVILLDVMMPGENGYRVAHAIREDEASGRLPHRALIFLVTARDLSDDPEREEIFLRFSGADAVIYKPFDLEVLVERLDRCLEGRLSTVS